MKLQIDGGRWGSRCTFQVIVDELVDLYMLSSDDGHASNARSQSDLTESLELVASRLQKSPREAECKAISTEL